MSASTAKQKNEQQIPLTTGRGAAISMTLGVTLVALGLTWLISLIAPGESYVLKQMNRALMGLGGSLCFFLPLLIGWSGIKLLVSTRHRVAVRDVALVTAIYLLILAGQALISRVMQGDGSVSWMDYIGKENYRYMMDGWDSYGAYLNRAYVQGKSGAGGLLGMVLAYPLWRILGLVLGTMLIAALLIVLILVLFRVNPGDLFRSAAERQDKRRVIREQKRREKEAAAQEQQAPPEQPQQEPQPVVQNVPMTRIDPGQRVQRQEAPYPPEEPLDYYQPAPLYATTPAYGPGQANPPPAGEGFYPVPSDLYDERLPLHPEREVPEAQDAPPVSRRSLRRERERQALVQEQPEAIPEEPSTPSRIPWRHAANTAAQPESQVPDIAPPVSPVPVQRPPIQKPTAQEHPSVNPSNLRQPAVRPPVAPVNEEPDEDGVPWETPMPEENIPVRAKQAVPAPAKTPAAPVETKPAPKPDWATQVRIKTASLEKQERQEMPEHTARKGEPKPVYTDPAVPITGEKILITPKPAEPRSGAKLDGTLPPKVKQGEMQLSIAYEAPPIRLLNESRHIPLQDTAQEDERKAQIIESTLGSFGVEAEVRQIMHGPSITRFAIQIAPGVKVSRVTTTADNLALDLKAKNVRVEAPIQGTSYIGIEVPNALVSTVALREVLDSPEMRNNPSPLVVALGKDIAGAPILCDLSKMPHLLIAGATGSGKSVCINSIVCSLLYRTSPEQVRLIMIDPKQVELNVYNCIPHLLVPVVSDPRKAAGALAWVVQEMMERYGKFSEQNVRNLAGYNKVNQGTDRVLPNIVVIIDEMADLMEVCRKDVEESIRRLAALARAAGIYMVLATQRPSVDVITGVIKNNIPSRIAFAVSSGTDSRTIIDINGAEKLMGKGDMLYKPAGTPPLRVQGCLVTDDEVNAITNYIASRYKTDYDPNVIEHLDAATQEKPEADEVSGYDEGPSSGGSGVGELSFHELLRQAIEMAVEDGQTSTSMLQRRLRVGYARAGRLIDEMEKRGIISASEGSKPRKTLITREQYDDLFTGEEDE